MPGQGASLEIALYKSETELAHPRTITWTKLAALLTEHVLGPCTMQNCIGKECPHKRGRAWSAVQYDGAGRADHNVVAVTAFVADLDEGGDAWREHVAGLTRIVHSSHSHRDGAPRLRLVLQLSRPVTADEYRRLWPIVIERFGIPADTTGRAASHLYFFPTAPEGAPLVAEFFDGAPLDVDELLATAPIIEAVTLSTSTVSTSTPDNERMLAAAELLGNAWPSSGRHAAHLALAGGLARAGWDADTIAAFAGAVAYVQDERNEDQIKRLKTARDTIAKLESGAAVLGWPSLAEHVEHDVVHEVMSMLGIAVPDDDDEFSSVLESASPDPTTKIERAKPGIPQAWHLHNGKPVKESEANMREALRCLDVRFSYDRFSEQEYVQHGEGPSVPVTDIAIKRLRSKIEHAFEFKPRKEDFYDACEVLAHENSFHPVLDYLDALPAPTTTDLTETWLIKYAGAEDTPYVRAVSRLALVAAVRRVREPGAKFDEMVVLEGPQGGGKSSLLRGLVPAESLYTDSVWLGMTSKEMIEQTAGKWIVEVPEMHTAGADSLVKAMLSKQEDRARGSYKRKSETVRRHFVIFGSTNEEHYLYDRTGNRRYWPIKVNEIDVAGLVAARDQLWAEAAKLEREGASIRLVRELWPVAAAEQAKRLRVHANVETEVLDGKLGNLTGKIKKSDVWKLLGYESKPPQKDYERITDAMRALGWESKREIRFGGTKANAYVKGTAAEREFTILRVIGMVGVGDGPEVEALHTAPAAPLT